MHSVEILMVEDSPSDAELARQAFKDGKLENRMTVIKDGLSALEYLRKENKYKDAVTPDLILLDLNLPKKNGQEVLAELKADDRLKHIPVVVLTTSDDERDVLNAYKLQASCYITKPVDFEKFVAVVRQTKDFWFSVVKLPSST